MENRQTILWIHGFAGCPDNMHVKEMRKRYPEYEWYSIEVDHHAKASMEKINAYIHEHDVSLVAGTSLGGYYAMCAEYDGPKLVVNPATNPVRDLRQFVGKCCYKPGRPDGQTEFEFTEEMLNEFAELHYGNLHNVLCHYTAHDQVLGEDIKKDYEQMFYILEMMDENILPGHFMTFRYIKNMKQTLHDLIDLDCEKLLYEMEIWTLANEQDNTDEEYKEQLEDSDCMYCGLCRESVGLFPTKECALEHLKMMYNDPFAEDRELYCAFIREKAMNCMMHPNDYIKEWTYVNGLLLDESLVRNYAEDENPFCGRPKEMIRFKKGDIVMIPDGYNGHWGIVWGVPFTPEKIKEMNKRAERKFGNIGKSLLTMDWSDDQYTILTNVKDNTVSHEHILAHHVLPAPHVPEFVRRILNEKKD